MSTNIYAADVRYYLWAWARWLRGWDAGLGYPSAVPYLDAMRPSPAEDLDPDDINLWLLQAVDAAIEDLAPPDRQAIRIIYLAEAGDIHAARARIAGAEAALIPLLQSRNIVLRS